MIKLSAQPLQRVVASGAILRKIRHLVVRAGGRIVVVLMAIPTLSGGNAVVAELRVVALLALQAGMRARQRKPGRGMVEVGAAPSRRGRVAAVAGRRETRLDVVRIVRGGEVRHVTLRACGIGDAVV